MPRIFLSPSTQEYNPYITGNGSEEYFMNQIADAMEPYLLANTIRFTRNTTDMTAASSVSYTHLDVYKRPAQPRCRINSSATGAGTYFSNGWW